MPWRFLLLVSYGFAPAGGPGLDVRVPRPAVVRAVAAVASAAGLAPNPVPGQGRFDGWLGRAGLALDELTWTVWWPGGEPRDTLAWGGLLGFAAAEADAADAAGIRPGENGTGLTWVWTRLRKLWVSPGPHPAAAHAALAELFDRVPVARRAATACPSVRRYLLAKLAEVGRVARVRFSPARPVTPDAEHYDRGAVIEFRFRGGRRPGDTFASVAFELENALSVEDRRELRARVREGQVERVRFVRAAAAWEQSAARRVHLMLAANWDCLAAAGLTGSAPGWLRPMYRATASGPTLRPGEGAGWAHEVRGLYWTTFGRSYDWYALAGAARRREGWAAARLLERLEFQTRYIPAEPELPRMRRGVAFRVRRSAAWHFFQALPPGARQLLALIREDGLAPAAARLARALAHGIAF